MKNHGTFVCSFVEILLFMVYAVRNSLGYFVPISIVNILR